MADRPILFSAPMVRALLAGRKTQTRRILKLPTKTHSGGPIYKRPGLGGWAVTTHGGEGCFTFGKNGEKLPVPERAGLWHQTTGTCVAARYALGDRLYVREEWCSTPAYDDLSPSDMGGEEPLRYRADDTTFNWAEADGVRSGRRRAGMHMPRWASRLTLTVTDVRVQRLQDISQEDAQSEGVDRMHIPMDAPFPSGILNDNCYKLGFWNIWEILHDKPGERWADNPWICAVSFSVERRNIDA